MRSIDLYRYTLNSGGGTFRASTLDPVTPAAGYAVALVPNDGGVQCDATDAAAFMNGIGRVRADYPAAEYIGTWNDGGRVYIDPVAIVADRESALELARRLRQLAVYSFEDAAEVTVA